MTGVRRPVLLLAGDPNHLFKALAIEYSTINLLRIFID
jgi:hypothetical protein